MFRSTLARFPRASPLVSRQISTEQGGSAAHKLAEEALAQKTGFKGKATLPKGDRKPAKAAGDKNNHWKNIALGAGAVTGGVIGGLFYYGRPFADGRQDKNADENAFAAAYHRCQQRYEEFQRDMHKPMWDKLLPDPLPEPYRRPYTLVINLDETLVYSTWDKENGWRHAKRPGVDYFLSYLSQFYEIVIFTSQSFVNAGPILDKLDPYQYAMYRLYRDATRYDDGQYIKDLSHLNRDLSKVIIMDSNPQSFSMQPENGVALKPWKGTSQDQGLLQYIPFLEAIALMNPDDIRPVLKSFEGKSIPAEWAKREAEMNARHLQQWEAEMSSKKTKRNLGSLLSGGAQQEQQGPPPMLLEQMRQHARTVFAEEHEKMKAQHDEAMKQDMDAQMEKMKEMKMTVWDLMTKVSSGQPIIPGQEPPQSEQQQQQPQQQ